MTGTVAQTIQGEAGSDPTAQFAVASTIYNRMQAGNYPGGSDPSAIVNAPNQYTGFSQVPNGTAQEFAAAISAGTLPQYGTVGNAVNFGDSTIQATSQGTNIGGNFFSDNWGPPTANFIPPSYGGTTPSGDQSPGLTINAPDSFNPPVSGAGTQGNTGQTIDPNTGAIISSGTGATSGGAYVANPSTQLEPNAKTTTGVPDVANALTAGFGSLSDTIAGYVGSTVAAAEAYLSRGFVMFFAIVIFAVAAWFLIPRDTKVKIYQAAGSAAKAAAV